MKKTYYILFTVVFFLCSKSIGNAQDDAFLSFTIDPMGYFNNIADIKHTPSSGKASSFQSGEGIEKSWDGNYSTLYHSQWGNDDRFPITLTYNFKNVDQIDYLIYHPRTSGTNGNFKKTEVWYTLKDGEKTKYGDYDFAGSGSPSTVKFDPALINPVSIEFVVKSGVGDNGVGFASCAEMEFYKKNSSGASLDNYFTDATFSELKPEITEEDIQKSDMPVFFKQLASELKSDDYSTYRVQEYEAYRPINDLASELKLSTYNAYENPTGIWVDAGDMLVIFVPETGGEDIALISRDWNNYDSSRMTYTLSEGVNRIQAKDRGLTYISYYTPNYKTAKPIKIHITGGKINGYFDRNKNTAEEWRTILYNAPGDHFDIKGDYTNLIFHIPSLKSNCPNDGMRLIELYDEIIEMEYDLMGFFKYKNRLPKNHMLGRNMPTGYMHADGTGAAFVNSTMNDIGNPSSIILRDNCWGIAHEYGHVNQVRPGLKWVGTAECTNNIYSSYVQYYITSKYSSIHLRLEHENSKYVPLEQNIIGGRFNCHLYYGQIKGENWLFQTGNDGASDHFVKLVPMWQLNLFFKIAKGTGWEKPDWFADICEETRLASDSELINDKEFGNGKHQINFMKRACKSTESDLTEFFEKAGMLKPIYKEIDDYGTQKLRITQEMCDEVYEYVKENGWQKPRGELGYISGNSVEFYEQKLPVKGGMKNPDGEMNKINNNLSESGNMRVVDRNYWQNAVAFETYDAENNLIHAVICGTGNKYKGTTHVPFPAGARKIVAVAWNGERTTIYEK